MTIQLGYCTNVHAGSNLQEMRRNLELHALDVKRQFSPDRAMGVGLWFSAAAASQLIEDSQVAEFGTWLEQHGLIPFTLNGFPYGDFHQPQVKHKVYSPDWSSRDRVDYTLQLIKILDELLPAGLDGSISTLPVAWRSNRLDQVSENLRIVARALHELREKSGRKICVCLEPEPGCHLQYASDAVDFFDRYLPADAASFPLRDYLTICHDVCHAAVMFESQRDVLCAYRDAGIRIGKVQVSSAIEIPFAELGINDRQDAMLQLGEFAEDRYLHQTVVQNRTDGQTRFFEDLPLAIQSVESQPAGVESLKDQVWRVHYHVPVFLESFGRLRSTQAETVDCCRLLTGDEAISPVNHWEVETYAWNVLPAALRQGALSQGIASELDWVARQLGD